MPRVLSKPAVARCEFDDYILYYKRMNCKTRRVFCARCREIMFINELSNHCHDKHDIDPLIACVTCFGQYTWRRGTKKRQGPHLRQCFAKYVEKYTVSKYDWQLYNNKVNSDSTNVKSDSTNVNFDSTNVNFDSTNVNFDSTNVSFDSTNVNFDSTNVNPDSVNANISLNLNDSSFALPVETSLKENGLSNDDASSRLSRRISRFEEGIYTESDEEDMDTQIDPTLNLQYERDMALIEDQPKVPEDQPHKYCEKCVAYHENPDKHRIITYPWSEEALRYVGNLNEPVKSPLSLPVDDGQRVLRYHDDTGLGRVHLYVNLYLETYETWQWYHFCIYAGAYASFLKIIQNQEIYVLEYSCLCSVEKDDSEFDEPRDLFRVHKHLILVVKNKVSFKNSLNKLECPPELQRGREKKFMRYTRKIEDLPHLGNVIAYVSTPSLGCEFDGKKGRKMRHHCIENPVVPHAMYLIAFLIENGLDGIAQYKFRGVGLMETKTRFNNKWYAPVSELGVLNCVPRFQPLNLGIVSEIPDENDLFVYWFNGTKRKVVEFPDDIPTQLRQHIDWFIQRDVNKILNLTEQEIYQQGLIQQRRLNEIAKNLKIQKAKLEREFQNQMQECRGERDRLLKERQDLKAKHVYYDNEIIELRERNELLIKQYADKETHLIEQFAEKEKRLNENYEKEKKRLIKKFEKETERLMKRLSEQEKRFLAEKQHLIKQNTEQETIFSKKLAEQETIFSKKLAEQETIFSKREKSLIKELVAMKKRFAEEIQY